MILEYSKLQAPLIYHHIHELGHPTRSRINIIIINIIIIISILILVIYQHPLAQHNACKCPCVSVCLFQCNPLHTPANYWRTTNLQQVNKCIPTPMAAQKNLPQAIGLSSKSHGSTKKPIPQLASISLSSIWSLALTT